MKICYTIDCSLNNGGAPISTHILAKEISKTGEEVYIIMPSCKDIPDTLSTITYCQLPHFQEYIPFDVLHPIRFCRYIRDLDQYIKRIDPDVIHAQMPRSGRAVAILRMLGRIEKHTKIVYTDREYVIDLKKRYHFLYRYTIARYFDGIVCLAETATIFWKRYINPEKLRVIPNSGGGLFDFYSDAALNVAQQTYPYLASENKINVIFVGRMTWEKRWPLAKETILKLNETYLNRINIILVLQHKNKEMKKETEAFLEDFAGIENVFVYQNLPQEELSKLYYISDIHVITSCRESFGRTAIEAMSRKNVVISTDAGAIMETIGTSDNIVEANPSSIIKKIEYYMDDTDRLDNDKDFFYKRYNKLYKTESNRDANMNFYL